jgi:spore coat protein JB
MQTTPHTPDYSLLRRLQEIDFVLVELTLYLDTHPEDLGAVQQFNHFAMERRKIAHEYEQQHGPLMHYGHSFSPYPWKWVEPPWPWQM